MFDWNVIGSVSHIECCFSCVLYDVLTFSSLLQILLSFSFSFSLSVTILFTVLYLLKLWKQILCSIWNFLKFSNFLIDSLLLYALKCLSNYSLCYKIRVLSIKRFFFKIENQKVLKWYDNTSNSKFQQSVTKL